MRNLRRVIWTGLGLLALALYGPRLGAQALPAAFGTMHYGYLTDSLDRALAAEVMRSPVERIWQVTHDTTFALQDAGDDHDSVTIVLAVTPCRTEGASPVAIARVSCPDTTAPTIHLHIVHDGNPSRADRTTMLCAGHHYDVVYVIPGAAVFYWRDESPLPMSVCWRRAVIRHGEARRP